MASIRNFATIVAFLFLKAAAQTPADFPVSTLANLGVTFPQFSVSPPGTLAPSLQGTRALKILYSVLT